VPPSRGSPASVDQTTTTTTTVRDTRRRDDDDDDDADDVRRAREVCAEVLGYIRRMSTEAGRARRSGEDGAADTNDDDDDVDDDVDANDDVVIISSGRVDDGTSAVKVRRDGPSSARRAEGRAEAEALAHRARLLKFRVKVARVRMQPRRARRTGHRMRHGDDGCTHTTGSRSNRTTSMTTTSMTTSSMTSLDDELNALAAVLAHAPYAHDALSNDRGERRGWTGSGSSMSRTGVIRVGDAHQAVVPLATMSTSAFVVGKPTARETALLGVKVWPPEIERPRTRSQSPSLSPNDDDDGPAEVRAPARISAVPMSDTPPSVSTEKASKSDDEDDGNAGEGLRRTPVVPPERVAEARARLEEALTRANVTAEALGLDTIGVEAGARRWTSEERRAFAEHVSRHADNLFPLRKALPGKTMFDIVNYYYNVWQVDCANDGRVDVAGSENPTPRVKKPSAPKIPPEVIQKDKDVKTLTSFVDWIRGMAMNPRRAIKNAYRAPATAKVKSHIMSRFRSVFNAEHACPGVDEFLKDLVDTTTNKRKLRSTSPSDDSKMSMKSSKSDGSDVDFKERPTKGKTLKTFDDGVEAKRRRQGKGTIKTFVL
jgi:hypothetical protein